MSKNPDYFTQDLLNETEELLKGLEKLNELSVNLDTSLDEELGEEIATEEMQSLERSLGLQANGYAEISTSEDEMHCFLDLYPPSMGGNEIALEDIEKAAADRGIYPRVDWVAVRKAVFECNTERTQKNDLLIAQGTPPRPETPQYIIISDALEKRGFPSEDRDKEKIDYKEINPYILVRKGEVLATIIPKSEGVPGRTVTGKEIPYSRKNIEYLRPGKNTEKRGDKIVAKVDGTFETGETEFHVNEVLEIAGDVNYKTGHINFPGDVIINGVVEDGFKVYSGGSIYCRQTLYASDVRCEKDLVVAQGIIGRQKGKAKVKGKISVKFIENCYIEAGGNIEVSVGILNSVVSTSGMVMTGKKGMIVGGRIYAQKGIIARQIGTASETRTEIICGIDYLALQKIEWIRDKNIELVNKLTTIEQKLRKESGESAKQLLLVQEKIKESIHNLNEAAKKLIMDLDKNDDASVVVQNVIYPGTYIEICHISHITTREARKVRFSLNKEKGRINCETYTI